MFSNLTLSQLIHRDKIYERILKLSLMLYSASGNTYLFEIIRIFSSILQFISNLRIFVNLCFNLFMLNNQDFCVGRFISMHAALLAHHNADKILLRSFSEPLNKVQR